MYDDDYLIDEQWLKIVGFESCEDGIGFQELAWLHYDDAPSTLWFGVYELPHIKTRGQLRCLCELLDIRLARVT